MIPRLTVLPWLLALPTWALHSRGDGPVAIKGPDAGQPRPHDASSRVAWFHPPKTATSFGATILRFANKSLPDDVPASALRYWGRVFKVLPGWFPTMWHEPCDHAAITDEVWYKYQGSFVGLFRQPEQRIVSAWHDKGFSKFSLGEYFERAKGTVTMQLAGQAEGERFLYWYGHQYCGKRAAPDLREKPVPDLAGALKRLETGFMFVGLVEEFDLSVCLFHAMHGGKCLPIEFVNMRPGGYQQADVDLHALEGLTDDVDGRLYDAARARFWRDIAAYGVSRSRCKELCPTVTGIFDLPDTVESSDADVSLSRRSEAESEFSWPGRHGLYEESSEGGEQ